MTQLVQTDMHRYSTIIYVHIPKTGGTTLGRILETQYGAKAIFREDSLRDLEALPQSKRDEISVYLGHVPFGVQSLFTPPVFSFTILRDPAKQAVSHFNIARVIGQPIGHLLRYDMQNFHPELPMADFFRTGFLPDNLQTRWLAGKEAMGLPFGALTAETLEVAKRNLREGIDIPGITERYDETLLLLARRLGWSPPCYLRENVGAGADVAPELTPEALEVIREQTRLDQELYDYGKTLLQAQIDREGSAFQSDLAAFQKANEHFQQLRVMARKGPWKPLKDALPTRWKVQIEGKIARVLNRNAARDAKSTQLP